MARSARKGSGDKSPAPDKQATARARVLIRIIFGLALFGLLLTVHLWIQSERGFSRGCFGFDNPEDLGIVECTAVVQSDAGKLFGISNVVYGFFFFALVAALSFSSVLAQREFAKTLRKISLSVATFGVLYALYLFSYQVFVLQMFCKLCLMTGLTTALIFGTHAVEWAGKAVPKFDLGELVREVGLYILMILVAGILLVAAVFFVNRIGTLEASGVAQAAVTAPPGTSTTPSGETALGESSVEAESVAPDPEEVEAELERVCHFDGSVPDIPDMASMTRDAPYYGDETAGVAMVEFFDPNCPHCRTLHERMPEIMTQVGDRAKLFYRPFPIWPFSYAQVEALYLAEDAGRFAAMLDEQMARQKAGGLSVQELSDIADDIGMDVDQFRRDLSAGKYRGRVNRERIQISQLGVNSVPKIAIEGRFVQSSSVNPLCIDYLVDKIELEG
jgi:protein-disulfide isomerase/uncharacterized membrane protein